MKRAMKSFACRSLLLILFIIFSPASGAKEGKCSDENFADFFERFSTDSKFSHERTAWPLLVSTEQFGEPSTRSFKKIKLESEHWAIEKMVSKFLEENPRVKTYFNKQIKSRVVVTFAVEDGDILFDFKYKKQNGCWKLVGIRDFDR